MYYREDKTRQTMKMIFLTSPMSSENVRARFDGPFPISLRDEFFVGEFSLVGDCLIKNVMVSLSDEYKYSLVNYRIW